MLDPVFFFTGGSLIALSHIIRLPACDFRGFGSRTIYSNAALRYSTFISFKLSKSETVFYLRHNPASVTNERHCSNRAALQLQEGNQACFFESLFTSSIAWNSDQAPTISDSRGKGIYITPYPPLFFNLLGTFARIETNRKMNKGTNTQLNTNCNVTVL
jgi:hypothetical protein